MLVCDPIPPERPVGNIPRHAIIANHGLAWSDDYAAGLFAWKKHYGSDLAKFLAYGRELVLDDAQEIEDDYANASKATIARELAARLYREVPLHDLLKDVKFTGFWGGTWEVMDSWNVRTKLFPWEGRSEDDKIRLAQWRLIRRKKMKDEDHNVLMKAIAERLILPRVDWRYKCLQAARGVEEPTVMGGLGELVEKAWAALFEKTTDSEPPAEAPDQIAEMVDYYIKETGEPVDVILNRLPDVMDRRMNALERALREQGRDEEYIQGKLKHARAMFEDGIKRIARTKGIAP